MLDSYLTAQSATNQRKPELTGRGTESSTWIGGGDNVWVRMEEHAIKDKQTKGANECQLHDLPVEPNPPAPLTVSERLVTSTGSGVTILSRISWAIRSPSFTALEMPCDAGGEEGEWRANAEIGFRTEEGDSIDTSGMAFSHFGNLGHSG